MNKIEQAEVGIDVSLRNVSFLLLRAHDTMI